MDLLRQIVASPRARHPEAGLDLCYVTDNIIATSGPSGTYPQVAYRNPLKDLVKFLDSKHKDKWAIWEFRAEGTGYPDEEVYGRIRHYPWPDHHPPPFALVPLIVGSMRNWLKNEGNVAVVHCKAGKGRSGTVSCSYLISEEGWTPEKAMQRFTERRMRPGFGLGISIPSQRRWISYVDHWTRGGKTYVERPVEIVEVHVWGLRDGVKIAVEGFVDEGKVIKMFHTFKKEERRLVRGKIRSDTGFADVAMEMMGKKKTEDIADAGKQIKEAEKAEEAITERKPDEDDRAGGDVVYEPSQRVVLPTSDVNIDFERRNKSKYGGFTMVTSVAHVWFNCFFEGNGPEQKGKADDSGVFSIDFDAMDGIKGSSRKGTRCFDKIQVVWKAVETEKAPSVKIDEPSQSTDNIPQARAADWRGADAHSNDFQKALGLREATSDSADVSRASSLRTEKNGDRDDTKDELDTVQASGPDGRALDNILLPPVSPVSPSKPQVESPQSMAPSSGSPIKHEIVNEVVSSQQDGPADVPVIEKPNTTTPDLSEGKKAEELKEPHDHMLGHIGLAKNSTTSS